MNPWEPAAGAAEAEEQEAREGEALEGIAAARQAFANMPQEPGQSISFLPAAPTRRGPGRPPGPHMPDVNPPKSQVKKMSWWHERMIDWMLLNPGKDKKEMAAFFGKSVATIYIITNSEVFKRRYAEASTMVTTRVMADVRESLEGLATGSVRELAARVHDEPDKVPTRELRELADMSLRNLGYGPKPGGVTAVFNNSVAVPAEVLARSREVMLGQEPTAQAATSAAPSATIEGELVQDDEPTDATAGADAPEIPAGGGD